MNILSEILSSRTRAEIFRLLFGLSSEELHIRELARRTGLNDSSIRQELKKLVRLELLISRKSGNRTYYRANESSPLYSEIRSLVMKTSGLVDVLKNKLQDNRIMAAFVFCSVASGSANAESDIDLMVIGRLGLRTFSGLTTGLSDTLGREINPHLLSPEEFQKRIAGREHFISSVLNSQKLFIIGNEDELETMGR
jgi:DNA-binding transcriptional ArsR family regulator